jgi:uncharacterized protein YbjT (DUF2867 family)
MPVRALVRPGSPSEHLRRPGVELCTGDLCDPASLMRACQGVSAVVATATVTFPRGRYDFARDEGGGYRNLLEACRAREVSQFLFTSIVRFADRYTHRIPTLRWKVEIERLARESGVPSTVFRAGPFMDDYFALMGSSLPLRGAEAATLRRPFWLSRAYLRCAGRLIENHGIALAPGPPDARHSFIALEDVASFLFNAIGHPDARDATYDIGGPQRLSWRDVAEIYGRVLGRRVRVLRCAPRGLLRLGAAALRPLSPAAANQLGILWCLAEHEIDVDCRDAARLLDVRLTSAEEFLLQKSHLVQD